MKIQKFNWGLFTDPIVEHSQYKDKLLELIKNLTDDDRTNHRAYHITTKDPLVVSKTDWDLPKDFKREYLDLFYTIVSPYMKKMSIFFKKSDWTITNAWFLQYTRTCFHSWHNHDSCMYSNIYFLELPNPKHKTELLDITTKKIIKYKAQEGDLLTFPSCITHRSKMIKDNNRKTIIAFNSNFMNK